MIAPSRQPSTLFCPLDVELCVIQGFQVQSFFNGTKYPKTLIRQIKQFVSLLVQSEIPIRVSRNLPFSATSVFNLIFLRHSILVYCKCCSAFSKNLQLQKVWRGEKMASSITTATYLMLNKSVRFFFERNGANLKNEKRLM